MVFQRAFIISSSCWYPLSCEGLRGALLICCGGRSDSRGVLVVSRMWLYELAKRSCGGCESMRFVSRLAVVCGGLRLIFHDVVMVFESCEVCSTAICEDAVSFICFGARHEWPRFVGEKL